MSLTEDDGKQQGSESTCLSFEGLVRRYVRLLDAVAWKMLEDHHDANDASQQAWLKAADAWAKGKRPGRPQPWLLTILRNEVRTILRRRRPLTLVGEPAAETKPDPLEVIERQDLVNRVLTELTATEREILELRYVEGVGTKQLCHRYGLSRSGLWERIEKARRRFMAIFRMHSEE